MKVLVTGANGQLGCELRLLAARLQVELTQKLAYKERGAKAGRQDAGRIACEERIEWIFSDISECGEREMLTKLAGTHSEALDFSTLKLDICDGQALRDIVCEHGIGVIINCAAYTNVEAAEDNIELAEKLNAKAPGLLAKVMSEVGGLLLHISTDYVFGGSSLRRPLREDDEPAPLGVYGRTKLDGEKAIESIGGQTIIVRTAWLYSEFGKNFFKTMSNLTSRNKQIRVVNDQLGSPTYARDLAELLLSLLGIYTYRKDNFFEVFHYSGEGQCTWHEFASEIALQSGHIDCEIQPCTSEEYPSKVRRPSYSLLDKSKIKNLLDRDSNNANVVQEIFQPWQERLREMLTAL